MTPREAKLTAENRKLKAEIKRLKTPPIKRSWTSVIGAPLNWHMLSPETQRSWVENTCAELLATAAPGEKAELELARLQALSNVGQPLER